jgi:cell division protein FtsW
LPVKKWPIQDGRVLDRFTGSLDFPEFVKPAFAVITAWMLSEQQKRPEFHVNFLSVLFLALLVFLSVLQLDIGMAMITMSVWFAQLFINGLSILFVVIAAALGASGFLLLICFCCL